MKYIIVEYGRPYVADDLPTYRPNRLAIVARTWEHVHAFSDTSRYALVIGDEPTSTAWQCLLAHTIYNPVVPISADWCVVGEASASDIITLVEGGLRTDDDVIEQWFGGEEVRKLLRAADTWEQLLIAVDCINGGHEINDDARRFVRAVLPEMHERTAM